MQGTERQKTKTLAFKETIQWEVKEQGTTIFLHDYFSLSSEALPNEVRNVTEVIVQLT